jgi:plastocyanin
MMIKNVCITLALIGAVACGGGGDEPTGPPTGSNNTPRPPGGVSVTNNAFTPAEKTITTGTTVTWAWSTCSGGGGYDNETCVAHSVNFDDGTNSPTQEKGSYTRTFTSAGSFPYHCAIHGTAMSGTIIVQ